MIDDAGGNVWRWEAGVENKAATGGPKEYGGLDELAKWGLGTLPTSTFLSLLGAPLSRSGNPVDREYSSAK